MKSLIILIISILTINSVIAQSTLIDKTGVAHFYSEAPLEDIEATNKKALGAFNLEKGTVAVSMVIKNFRFDNSLMEEHFNENYMESEKFPKASFTGKIQDFSTLDFSTPGTFTAKAEGELEIHGVKRPLTNDVTFEVTKDAIIVKTKFKVALEDHEVEIPTLVIKNIAEIVDVDVAFNFLIK